jgi:hypothetical protein
MKFDIGEFRRSRFFLLIPIFGYDRIKITVILHESLHEFLGAEVWGIPLPFTQDVGQGERAKICSLCVISYPVISPFRICKFPQISVDYPEHQDPRKKLL